MFYQLKIKYKEYHKMKTITDDKWNLLLFLLNQQTDELKVKQLLSDEKFNKMVICNKILSFEKLLMMNDLLCLQKNETNQERKYENQVEEAIGAIDDFCNKSESLDIENHELIIEELNRIFKRIHEEIRKNGNSIKNKRARILEKMFNEVNIFLKNSETSGMYIDCLDNILSEEFPKKKKNVDNEEFLLEKPEKPSEVNFLKKNIKRVYSAGSGAARVYGEVNLQNRPLYEQNVPKLQLDSAFTRRELYKLYIKYKAVCAIFGLQKELKKQIFDPTIGFDKKTFKENFVQFKVSTDDMIDRIFEFGEDQVVSQGMSWPKFLRLMMSVRAKSVKDKVALFLCLMDTDGNGSLSFEEVAAVCRSALDRFKAAEEDKLIGSLADYFAKIVFEAVEMDHDSEIPLEKLREVMDKNLEAVDLLLAFAGAKQSQDDDIILENNCIPNRLPKIQLDQYHDSSN